MATLRRALPFALVCGLLAASFEIARLDSGGIALAASLRATLVAIYGVFALVAYLLAALVTASPRRRWVLAGGACAALVLVPWVNFEFLPGAFSARSLLGSAFAVLIAFAVAALAARLPRLTALVALTAFSAANVAAGARGAKRGGEHVTAASGRPSVVVVLIDTLRADHLGAYGYDRPTSPNFDRLALEGVLFERTIAQAAWTKPSVASLMTGRFVHHHGVIRSRDALGTDLPTMAASLRENGYRTAAFSGNPWITPEFRFDRGFDEFTSGRPMGPQLTVLYKLVKRLERWLGRAGVHASLTDFVFFTAVRESPVNSVRDAQLAREVAAWLADPPAEPFFLYVHFIGPHDPYDPPAEFVRRFQSDDAPYPTVPPARVQSVFETAAPLDDVAHRKLVAQYDAAIAYADSLLGQVVDAVKKLSQTRDTLLVVTADHGEEFYEHGNWRHGNQLYDEVIHVPLLMWMPGRLAPQRRADAAMLVDVFPTVLDLTAAPRRPVGGDGRALFAADRKERPAVFSEHRWFEGGDYVARLVENGSFKLHDVHDGGRGRERQELYDIETDAGEKNDLIGAPPAGARELLPEMRSELAHFGTEVAPGAAPTLSHIDAQTKERLRALGYE